MKTNLKNLVVIILLVSVCVVVSGCSFGIKVAGGAGQTGNQAANNMFNNKGAGDHSTGTGAGFNQEDSLPGLFRSFRRQPTN